MARLAQNILADRIRPLTLNGIDRIPVSDLEAELRINGYGPERAAFWIDELIAKGYMTPVGDGLMDISQFRAAMLRTRGYA